VCVNEIAEEKRIELIRNTLRIPQINRYLYSALLFDLLIQNSSIS